MHDTLVNHKREALLSHQTKSASLQKELEGLSMERDGIEARKDQALDEVGGLCVRGQVLLVCSQLLAARTQIDVQRT